MGRGAVVVLLALAVVPLPALSHQAPMGWTYERICCSDQDCRPIPAGEVEATRTGWRIRRTGEVVAYAIARHSQDGAFHRCSIGGRDETKTLCLYVPDLGL